MYRILTFKSKNNIYIGLLSTGIFSRLYYVNSKDIEQVPNLKTYNFPADIDTILSTHDPMKKEPFNIRIDSNIVNGDPNHMFRIIKLFGKQVTRVKNGSWTDVLTEYAEPDIIEKCTHVQDIPSKLSFVEAQFKHHKIVSSQYQFLPYIHICNHTIGISTNTNIGTSTDMGTSTSAYAVTGTGTSTECRFNYLDAMIYSNAPIQVLKTKHEIKNLFIDAGYSEVAEQFIQQCKTLPHDSSIIAYTQIINSPAVYMNVIRKYNDGKMPYFDVQVISDDEETLVKKTVEKYDNQTLYGSLVLFSLCVVVRNLLPF